MYKLDNNRYPTTEQGWMPWSTSRPHPEPRSYRDGGYIKRLPQDPGAASTSC